MPGPAKISGTRFDFFEQQLLLPLAVLAEHEPMVAHENDTVFSARPSRSSASSNRPTCESTKLTDAK